MKRNILISIAAFAVACGGGSHDRAGRETAAPAAETTPSGSAARETSGANSGGSSAAARSTRSVTLIGCLMGPAPTATTGTSGSRAQARATGPETVAADSSAGAPTDRFRLTDAAPTSSDSAGVGANGAGGSGGPLVSGSSSFVLDAVPMEARGHVNAKVRVVGRIDANPLATGEAAPASSGGAAVSAGAGSSGTSGSANTGGARRLLVESVEVVSPRCDR